MTGAFIHSLAAAVRSRAIDAQGSDPVIAEGAHFRITQAGQAVPAAVAPVAANDPGASYSLFVHLVEVEVRAWGYGARFCVAMHNNRKGMEAGSYAIELLAENFGGQDITLANDAGEELLYNLDQMALDHGSEAEEELRKIITSVRVVQQIVLCGRCEGQGAEHDGAPCRVCLGGGEKARRERAGS